MTWWVALAVLGAVLLGAAIAFGLAGPRPAPGVGEREQRDAANEPELPRTRFEGTRFDLDNRVAWNPWAFLTVGGLVAALAALALLLKLL